MKNLKTIGTMLGEGVSVRCMYADCDAPARISTLHEYPSGDVARIDLCEDHKGHARPPAVMPAVAAPRRNRLELMTPAELAIREAVLKVEELGCDTRLTDAVMLLGEAQEKVADYIDSLPQVTK